MLQDKFFTWIADCLFLEGSKLIKNALVSIRPSMKSITKDKVNFTMALIPVLIGIALYYYLGSWIYESATAYGKELIESYISQESFGAIVYWLVAAILTVMLFFLVNWTFVLVVTLISCPFNDILSSRIEKQMRGESTLDLGLTFSRLISKLFFTLLNEFKKILFIGVLSLLSFVFGYIPLIAPIGIFLAIILLAVEFLDYSWSRHDLRFKECVSDLKGNIAGYSFGGAFFFIMVSVPLINLFVPPMATSYFTTLWVKNHESRN